GLNSPLYDTIPSEFDSNSTNDEVLNRRSGQDDLSADVAISDEVNIVTGLTQLEDAPLRRQYAILGAARARLLDYQTSEVAEAPNRVLTDERADLYEAELEKISNLIKQKKAQMLQAEQAAPEQEQAPVEQVLPEVVPQVVPATEQAPEQAPAVRGNFRISPRMAKSKPRYRGQTVAYGSELELAVYMATAKGKNASKVRSELIEAGYSPAEINALGSEVRSQMKKGYNPNSKKPISVAIAQDVTAEASGVDRLSMSFKNVLKRTPEIQEQAKILKENIKAGDRQQSRRVAEVADEFKPVHAYDFVPAPETNSDMRTALKEDQVPFFNAVVPDGKLVAMR
ncbi:unnamed protein product, partial [marine sediment metagenome]